MRGERADSIAASRVFALLACLALLAAGCSDEVSPGDDGDALFDLRDDQDEELPAPVVTTVHVFFNPAAELIAVDNGLDRPGRALDASLQAVVSVYDGETLVSATTDAEGSARFEDVLFPATVTAQLDFDGLDGRLRAATSLVVAEPRAEIGLVVFGDALDPDSTNPRPDPSTFIEGTLAGLPDLEQGQTLSVWAIGTGGGPSPFFQAILSNPQASPPDQSFSLPVGEGTYTVYAEIRHAEQADGMSVSDFAAAAVYPDAVEVSAGATTGAIEVDFEDAEMAMAFAPRATTWVGALPDPTVTHLASLLLTEDGRRFDLAALVGRDENGLDRPTFGTYTFVSAHPSRLTGLLVAQDEADLEDHSLLSTTSVPLGGGPAMLSFLAPPTLTAPSPDDNPTPAEAAELSFAFTLGSGANLAVVFIAGETGENLEEVGGVQWRILVALDATTFTLPPTPLPMFADGQYIAGVIKLRFGAGEPIDLAVLTDFAIQENLAALVSADGAESVLERELRVGEGLPGFGGGEPWGVVFTPDIDMGPCLADLSWSGQNVVPERDGSFDEVWAPNEPNTARVTGTLTEADFDAVIACFDDGDPSGTLTAERVDGYYEGTFEFADSTGGLLVFPVGGETVTLQGRVFAQGNGSPINGARVTASVDAESEATTNELGVFYLVTAAPTEFCCTPYTVTVAAEGFVTFSEEATYGDHPIGLSFGLTAQ